MSDCPNCECEYCYEQIDDEWVTDTEYGGYVVELLWGETICPSCGYAETFEADKRYVDDAPFGFGSLMSRGYD